MRCAFALFAVAGCAASLFAQVTGPNAGATPYMLPASASSGVQFISIATSLASQFYTNLDTGASTYRMVGIPDGLGIYRDADDIANNTFSVLMNHELGASAGSVRAHGSAGAFVSQWKIRRSDFGVVGGRDFIQSVNTFNNTTGTFTNGTTAFGRLCSADLAPVSAYQWTDAFGNNFGTSERIYMNGEEVGATGRAFAHVVSGTEARQSWELPDLADFSWENSVANPLSQRKTIVAGTDDSTPGQVYFYVGDKQATGNTIEKAGLMNGKTYGLKVDSLPLATPFEGATALSGSFSMVDMSTSQRLDGNTFQSNSRAAGVTEFARPEDSAWNPSNPAELVWVNTGGTVNGVSVPTRIYKSTFTDITNPEAGGTISLLGQGNDFSTFSGGVTSFTPGTTTANSFDNIAISRFNQVLLQEDVGNVARLGRLWLYDMVADSMVEIGISDSNLFLTGGTGFLTQDEETSGIVDAWDIIGPGWWLLDMQSHNQVGGELVEGGQLMAVFIPQTVPTPAGAALLGLAGLAATRRRR